MTTGFSPGKMGSPSQALRPYASAEKQPVFSLKVLTGCVVMMEIPGVKTPYVFAAGHTARKARPEGARKLSRVYPG
jgi:hypothetical protein